MTDIPELAQQPPSEPPPAFTCEQIRRVDEVAIHDWGVPGVVLMENAGRGVADVLCEAGIEGRVIIACAKGNNGGDGFVIARHLHLRGFQSEVLLCCDPTELRGDARAMFDFLLRCDVPIQELGDVPDLLQHLRSADWLVDAMLGTGAIGAPRPPIDEIIQAMNATMAMRLAVDVPSGLNADTGLTAENAFRANHTCTFVALKQGFLQDTAKPYLGEIHCLDIGIPWNLVEEIVQADAQQK